MREPNLLEGLTRRLEEGRIRSCVPKEVETMPRASLDCQRDVGDGRKLRAEGSNLKGSNNAEMRALRHTEVPNGASEEEDIA